MQLPPRGIAGARWIAACPIHKRIPTCACFGTHPASDGIHPALMRSGFHNNLMGIVSPEEIGSYFHDHIHLSCAFTSFAVWKLKRLV